MKSSKKPNGKSNGNAAVKPPSDPKEIELSEADKKPLREHDHQLARLKISLADIEMHRELLDLKRAEVIAAINKKNQDLQNEAKAVARSHGIDPEGAAPWRIDLTRMVLVQI